MDQLMTVWDEKKVVIGSTIGIGKGYVQITGLCKYSYTCIRQETNIISMHCVIYD